MSSYRVLSTSSPSCVFIVTHFSHNLSFIMSQPDKLDRILSKLNSMESRITSINTHLASLTTTVKTLQTTVDNHTKEIAELCTLMDQQKTEINKLKLSHHRREQRLRSTTIRLFNFPYTVGESLENFKALSAKVYDRVIRPTLAAAKAAGDLGSVPQQQNAVEACFRAYRQEQEAADKPPPPVVIRLSNNIKFAVMKHAAASPPPQ